MKINQFYGIGEYFARMCMKWGQRTFLKEKETASLFSYAGFWEEMQCSVAALQDGGVQPGERIVLCMENSAASLAMFMGSLVAGVVPAVVSSNNRSAEIRHICETCDAVALYCSSENRGILKGKLGIPVIFFDESLNLNSEVTSTNRIKKPDDTAYIVFTSGSTSSPKKVEVSHHNMLTEIESMAEAYGLTEDDRHLCVLPIFHASGLYRNVLLPFHTGGYVFLLKEFREDTFWHEIASEEITFVQVVPYILRTLLRQEKYFKEGQQKSLRFIGSASAPHPIDLLRAFEERFGVLVLQGYGMTEATCGITLSPLNSAERKLSSVGKPLSVNTVEIWDEEGGLLPPGMIGRIIVHGENITTYSEVPDAVRSNEDPLGKRVLDTGDMGYLDGDGFLWIDARREDMIKRGGYRISPNEIEEAITGLFPRLEVAVLGVPHSFLGQDVVAFVVDGKHSLTPRDIIRGLKGRIASFKIPSEIIFLEAIPRLGVGKSDKKKLLDYYQCASTEVG